MRAKILGVALIATVLTVPLSADELAMHDWSVMGNEEAGNDNAVESQCKGMCYCDPLWTFHADVLALKQESPSMFKAFDFDFEAGVNVSAMRRLGDCHAVEVRYFGIDDWSAGVSAEIPSIALQEPPVDIPFVFNDLESLPRYSDLGATYVSELHSTEINLHRQCTQRISVLAGFRWVEMHEELGLDVFDDTVLKNDADNHMYGFQIGGEAMLLDRGTRLQISTGVKAGIYYNRSDVSITASVPEPIDVYYSDTFKEDHVAFLGEWDVTASFALTECLAVRAGYEVLWIDGSTRAEGQVISALRGDGVDTSGGQMYHGGVLGVELTY
jgi:hypothetical protein